MKKARFESIERICKAIIIAGATTYFIRALFWHIF
jgi:hypothetical protein